MSHATIVLVIAPPSLFRNSLITLLSTLPEIEIVAEARDLSALDRVGKEWQPGLIILDADCVGHSPVEALRQIKRKWEQSQIVILVESMEQERLAVNAGFETVFLKGARVTLLIDMIEKLLPMAGREAKNIDG